MILRYVLTMHRTANRRRGFTLIELLVVIGIITLLVGILVPVLGGARRAGQAAVCLSNLRSMGQATVAYSADHRRHLPQPATESGLPAEDQQPAVWFNALDRYLGEQVGDGSRDERNYATFKQDPVWLNLPDTVNTSSGPQEFDPELVRTLKMNQFFGHMSLGGFDSTAELGRKAGDDVGYYRLTDVPEPSSTVLYGDGRAHDTTTDSGIADRTGAGFFAMRPIYVGLRHDGGANLSHVDGSAAFQQNPVDETSTGYQGWHYRYGQDTFDEDERALWPEVTFNFRPESFENGSTGEGFKRRYPRKD